MNPRDLFYRTVNLTLQKRQFRKWPGVSNIPKVHLFICAYKERMYVHISIDSQKEKERTGQLMTLRVD